MPINRHSIDNFDRELDELAEALCDEAGEPPFEVSDGWTAPYLKFDDLETDPEKR